jgi:hypothetical protein
MKLGSRLLVLVHVVAAALAPPAAVEAQDTVANDPIRCWWRTSTGAVRLGETFSLVLTCAVLDTDAVQVVPDESRLSHAVVQLAPFDVVTGSHPPDVRSGQRRFLQYEYTLRALNADLIAQDVALPPIVVNYRVNSRLSGNAALQGRDLTYILPPLQVRVVSLVPADATDIRDTPNLTFGAIESLRYRAGVFDIAGITLIAVGSIMIVAALVGLLRRKAPREARESRLLGEWSVLSAAGRELAEVETESGAQGWTDALLDRALAAVRLTAAAAIGRRVSQRPAEAMMEAGQGRLLARRLPRGAHVALSSPATAADVDRAIARLPASAAPARRQRLEELRDALQVLTAAQYARARPRDNEALRAAVANAAAAARSLKSEHLWPRPQLRRRFAGGTPQPERM